MGWPFHSSFSVNLSWVLLCAVDVPETGVRLSDPTYLYSIEKVRSVWKPLSSL